MKKTATKFNEFEFQLGKVIFQNYALVSKLGAGWESEVYKVKELSTGIERAAKFFFPQRNIKNKTAMMHAYKMHKLKECPIVVQYHHQNVIQYKKTPITVVITEYINGEMLSDYLLRLPGKRCSVFQAIHLLYELTKGIDQIHSLGEYHGDLHTDNVLIRKHGLSYDLKVFDFFNWGRANRENRDEDICNLIRIFYDALGGVRYYSKLPQEVKEICLGLKRGLILKKFKTAGLLKNYLETFSWS